MGYKKYKVNVEGREYTVEVEELTGYNDTERTISREAGSSSSVSSVPESKKEPVSEPVKKPTSAAGQIVKAPLQGSIIGVAVKEGQSVKEGDILLKIEALKMENEILAPCSGVISSVNVKDGDRVASGDVLCSIS